MAGMLVPMLGVVFIPKIAFFHAAGNQPEVENQVYKSQEVLFFFSMPLCAFFFILAPEIMYVFASGSFQVTITVIRILSPVPLLAGLSHLAGSQVLLPIKQEKIFFLILAAGCLLNVILDLALIPVLQEKGAAFANVSVEAFVAAGTCWYLYSRGLLHVAKKQLAVCFAVSLLLLPTVYFFRYLEAAPPVVLFLSVFVTGAVYVFVYFKTFPHTVIKELVPFWKRI
jgi:O-antigen/teichoic acid export membrane protein